MSCRCSDIQKCRDDQNVIENIKDILSDMKQINQGLDTELTSMSHSVEVSFEKVDTEELKSAIKKLDDANVGKLDSIISACDIRSTWLSNQYDQLCSEDDAYHNSDD